MRSFARIKHRGDSRRRAIFQPAAVPTIGFDEISRGLAGVGVGQPTLDPVISGRKPPRTRKTVLSRRVCEGLRFALARYVQVSLAMGARLHRTAIFVRKRARLTAAVAYDIHGH